ncbi:50S ribosomal protein L44e [Candidatus Pacearchaeota archaeon]|nr:50S ribosomal protein L44e [Candidatus Pacearchaeota archaeon]MBD3282881.1 50S ribosomal protein L44e [Candidatus Pacearchaeota archaeon]
MKIPKKTNRFCPKCNKKTEHKIDIVSTGFKRGTLTRGSISRTKARGGSAGKGNKGKYSRKAIKNWKRKTKTTTRKVLIYKCQECKKSTLAKKSRRVSKLLIE